jgi:hypothetical protein
MGERGRAKRWSLAVVIGMLVSMGMVGIAEAQSSEEGVANFYNDNFQGKKTASGQLYDKNGLTAAYKKLPYGKGDQRRKRKERGRYRQRPDGRVEPRRHRRHAPPSACATRTAAPTPRPPLLEVRGARNGIDVEARLQAQADGSIRVEFRTTNAAAIGRRSYGFAPSAGLECRPGWSDGADCCWAL